MGTSGGFGKCVQEGTPCPSVTPISWVNISASILRISGPLEVEKLLWLWWAAGMRSTSSRQAGMASSLALFHFLTFTTSSCACFPCRACVHPHLPALIQMCAIVFLELVVIPLPRCLGVEIIGVCTTRPGSVLSIVFEAEQCRDRESERELDGGRGKRRVWGERSGSS